MLPMCLDCDIMDFDIATVEYLERTYPIGKSFVMDAGVTPWPIADKSYDAVIGLQVWEHLAREQRSALLEAQRVSDHLIITLPYEWNCPENKAHHMISDKHVEQWFDGVEPAVNENIGESPFIRKLLYYEFD